MTLAQYQFNQNDLVSSSKNYKKVLSVQSAIPQKDKAQYMLGQVYYAQKSYLPSLASFQAVLKNPASAYASGSKQMMEFIITYCLSQEDLQSFVTNYPDSTEKCTALFQLGSKEYQAGANGQALDHLDQFVQSCPQHPSVSSARMLSQTMRSQQVGKTWNIGVLAPRTGDRKEFGDSVVNGINLAVQDVNLTGGALRHTHVVVQDTAGDPIQAVKVFQDMTKDNSLDAVIGPVLPSEIQGVAALANQQKIVLISPTNSRDGLSSLGNYIFSNGMTNEMQGRAMAHYAVDKLGIKTFGILAPEDNYGQILTQAFTQTVEALGATVTASNTYPAGATDFKKQIIVMGGLDPDSSKENDRENNRRSDELRYNLKKEVGKILLKVRDLSPAAQPASGPSTLPTPIALIPMVEGLTNTTCPSIALTIDGGLRDALVEHADFELRTNDLIQQALTSLPPEFKGNTKAGDATVWGPIAQDLQAKVLITGRVVETDPPADFDPADNTWNFSIYLEAYLLPDGKDQFIKFYQSRLLYGVFKPTSGQSTVKYQALYLPAHAAEVPLLAAQVHFYDLNPILLGGHLWGNASVLQEAAKDVEGAYFVTGYYADSQEAIARKFTDDYMKAYAKKPDLLAAQAYDAARLLLQAMNGATDRDSLREQLSRINNFVGASGLTSFNGKGEAEKQVPILQIKSGKYQQVQ
jgi:ABC-type branched-subunit amino acid transport system substrate-binding protein